MRFPGGPGSVMLHAPSRMANATPIPKGDVRPQGLSTVHSISFSRFPTASAESLV